LIQFRQHMVSPRALLTEAEAVEIYSYKSSGPKNYVPLFKGSTTSLSKKYNISPKAIRDIWNHRTWRLATRHMWTGSDTGPKQKKANKRAVAYIHVNKKLRAITSKEDTRCFSTMPLSLPPVGDLSILWPKSLPSFRADSLNSSNVQQLHQSNPQETHNSRIDIQIGHHLDERINHKLFPLTESQGCTSPGYLYPASSSLHSTHHASQQAIPHVLLDCGPLVPSLPQCPPTDSLPSDTFTMSCIFEANDDPFHFDWPHW